VAKKKKKRYLFSFWHGYNKTGMEVVDVSEEQVSFFLFPSSFPSGWKEKRMRDTGFRLEGRMNCGKKKKKKKMLRRRLDGLVVGKKNRKGPSSLHVDKRHVFERRNDLGHSCHSVPLWKEGKKEKKFHILCISKENGGEKHARTIRKEKRKNPDQFFLFSEIKFVLFFQDLFVSNKSGNE
jgi:hypothetical protein